MLTLKDILYLSGRFIFNLIFYAAAPVHTILLVVPEANRPAAVAASLAAALVVAMYDSGVFHIESNDDLNFH